MSLSTHLPDSRRGQPRVAFDGAVQLRYRLFQQFLSENAANISSGGMFIRTRQPGEPGEELEFKIALEDDFTLIEGRAQVVWARRPDAAAEGQPGMGVRFVELQEESRALIDKIVAERVAEGLELFDVEQQAPAERQPPRAEVPPPPAGEEVFALAPPGEAEPATPAPPPPSPATPPAPPSPASPSAGPASGGVDAGTSRPAGPSIAEVADKSIDELLGPAPGRRRTRRAGALRLVVVALLSALAGAASVLLFQQFYVQPSIEALETPIEDLAGSPGGPWQPPAEEPPTEEPARPFEAAGPQAPAAGEQPSVEGGPAVRPTEIVDTLRAWATAWSRQRFDDYLSFYAADFEPPDGLDRAAWEAARRERIAAPGWIRVALTLVEVEETGAGTAEARFVQSYRSERYNDLVRKHLTMVREDGEWKIAAERVVR